MCGIFGIITKKKNLPIGKIVLEGIKRLEYRGYDSCGIVALFNSKLYVKKDSGKIDEIQKKTDLTEFPHSVFCEFDDSFLKLPIEVLASEMIEHQNYFPLKIRLARA